MASINHITKAERDIKKIEYKSITHTHPFVEVLERDDTLSNEYEKNFPSSYRRRCGGFLRHIIQVMEIKDDAILNRSFI